MCLQHLIKFVLLVESRLSKNVITAAHERVLQNFLGLLNLDELCGCVDLKILIRVILAAQIAVGLLELSFSKRGAFKLKEFVVIFLLL